MFTHSVPCFPFDAMIIQGFRSCYKSSLSWLDLLGTEISVFLVLPTLSSSDGPAASVSAQHCSGLLASHGNVALGAGSIGAFVIG